jgi:cysteinyl-tRNA synthetase
MHNGMLTVGGAKMAKSEGNFVTVRDALAGAPGEVIRLALLGTHYRDPLDWTEDRLRQARQTLDRFYRVLTLTAGLPDLNDPVPQQVSEALEDDLNAPLAIAHLHELSGEINRAANVIERGRLQGALRAAGRLVGLLDHDPVQWLQGDMSHIVAITARAHVGASGRAHLDTMVNRGEPYIHDRISARALARRERRFADADLIRAELASEGIILEDKPDGTTTWRRV